MSEVTEQTVLLKKLLDAGSKLEHNKQHEFYYITLDYRMGGIGNNGATDIAVYFSEEFIESATVMFAGKFLTQERLHDM